MNIMTKTIAAAALTLAWAPAAFAQAGITCGQFNALDGTGKREAARDVLTWTQQTGNASEAGILAAQFTSATVEEVQQMIDRRCSDASSGSSVIAQLQAGDNNELKTN